MPEFGGKGTRTTAEIHFSGGVDRSDGSVDIEMEAGSPFDEQAAVQERALEIELGSPASSLDAGSEEDGFPLEQSNGRSKPECGSTRKNRERSSKGFVLIKKLFALGGDPGERPSELLVLQASRQVLRPLPTEQETPGLEIPVSGSEALLLLTFLDGAKGCGFFLGSAFELWIPEPAKKADNRRKGAILISLSFRSVEGGA